MIGQIIGKPPSLKAPYHNKGYLLIEVLVAMTLSITIASLAWHVHWRVDATAQKSTALSYLALKATFLEETLTHSWHRSQYYGCATGIAPRPEWWRATSPLEDKNHVFSAWHLLGWEANLSVPVAAQSPVRSLTINITKKTTTAAPLLVLLVSDCVRTIKVRLAVPASNKLGIQQVQLQEPLTSQWHVGSQIYGMSQDTWFIKENTQNIKGLYGKFGERLQEYLSGIQRVRWVPDQQKWHAELISPDASTLQISGSW